MAQRTRFFLGANSGNGFYSLYDQLGEQAGLYDFLILKGGPGVGKSTFMKYMARRAEKEHLDVEYIHCSGDPDSLDGILLPQLGVAVADGTAPHVLEPRYPAAVDRYVNLGQFYDVARMKERRREVIACSEEYRKEYAKAYTCLHAARAVLRFGEEQMASVGDVERMRRRLMNVWRRERKRSKGTQGWEERRFLSALTPAGRISFEDTIFALCTRAYEIRDPWHVGASALQSLRDAILADGGHVITCLDADAPERIEHLLLPELSLAFVTTGRGLALSRKPWRRMRQDYWVDADGYRQIRGNLRLKEQLAHALEEEGAEHLRLAGEKHGELEEIYHPFVDFDGVLALAEEECVRIFG